MIVVYPMITSSAVGENAIPGIAKMIENYLIAFSMDDVLRGIKLQRRVNFKMKGRKLWMMEAKGDPLDAETMGIGTKGTKSKDEPKPKYGKPQSKRDLEKFEKEKGKFEKEKEKYELGKEKEKLTRQKQKLQTKKDEKLQQKTETLAKSQAKFDAEMKEAKRKKIKISGRAETKTLSLEPTYVQVETEDGQTLIGVKVVPMRVSSDAKLSYLILSDLKLGFIKSGFISVGRKILRWVYSFTRGAQSPTGDPRKDIIMDKTGLKGNAFVVLDKHHDIDEALVNQPKALQKLFGLSWGNIVIVDDIQRQAAFCMKKFKGICNIIPYTMMYQSLGQKDVYEDLEDARKKSGSLFKYRKSVTKVIGEQIAENKMSDYYFLREDLKNEEDR